MILLMITIFSTLLNRWDWSVWNRNLFVWYLNTSVCCSVKCLVHVRCVICVSSLIQSLLGTQLMAESLLCISSLQGYKSVGSKGPVRLLADSLFSPSVLFCLKKSFLSHIICTRGLDLFVKSILINRDILTWHLIGWWLCCQTDVGKRGVGDIARDSPNLQWKHASSSLKLVYFILLHSSDCSALSLKIWTYLSLWYTFITSIFEQSFELSYICIRYWGNNLGAVSIRKTVLPGMAIPMLKIRRPNGRLIFNMEIAIRR